MISATCATRATRVVFHRGSGVRLRRGNVKYCPRPGIIFSPAFSNRQGISLARNFAFSGTFSRALDSRVDAADFRWRQAHVDDRNEDPDQSVISVFLVYCYSRALARRRSFPWFSHHPDSVRIIMADLDDFFAKKDRKKAKGKKFATTDEVAKKLEETGKRIEKPKPKEKPANPEGEESQHTEDEDEWKEFEEEKKDYSGLKIGHLTINDSLDAESDDERGTGENSSDGESGEGGTKHTGPWKKPDLPPEAPEVTVAPPPPVVSTGSSYKAPHLRNQSTFTSPRPRGRNVAPDIHSEEYFPTLNSKPQQSNGSNPWGRKRREEGAFEEVRNRGSSRSYNASESQVQVPKLSLGNKYGALSQDQS